MLKAKKLESVIKKGTWIEHAPMREYTSFRAGGTADLLVSPGSEEELRQCLRLLNGEGEPFLIMGNGSNLLVRDGGYRGTIVRMNECCNEVEGEGPDFRVGAGVSLSVCARMAMEKGFAGMEFACGIPGSMGGGTFMNAGAYGGELKDIITSVDVLHRDGSGGETIPGEQMAFGYRHSALMESGDIATAVRLRLVKGDPETIAAEMKTLTVRRNARQPVNYPSAGSFFKRPPNHFAGKLIQDAGLKGLTVGGAQVSVLHSGFIINTGTATATDIIQLMHLIQARVKEQSGVMLEPEVRLIGEDQ